VFEFLTVEDVLEIHESQLERFGGGAGLRDVGLLESAVAQPQASFGGEYVHGDIFEMAAAYLLHIVNNHAFVDGNKRTGLLAALVFLDTNGVSLPEESELLYELTMGVAEGRIPKSEVVDRLRELATNVGDR
jgi:death-on-curing protein